MDDSRNPVLDEQNPWPGLAAYGESDANFFNGRTTEVDELFRLVGLSHLVAFYGKSGLGKSSLLQAGLLPRLRAAHFLPVLVRIDYAAAAPSPSEQIAQKLIAELARTGADFQPPASGESLWRYLHRRELEFWSRDNHPLVPVFVLDQFEEFFSLGGRDQKKQAAIKVELACLFENLEPPELASTPERSARSGLDTAAHRYRTLISFREDFLPEVREWARDLPALLKRELRLLPMTRKTAIKAVEESGRAILRPGTAKAIVDFIGNISQSETESDKTIEPVLLSLCCYRLNMKRPMQEGIRQPIDSELLHDFGEGILEEFYHEALAGMPGTVAKFIEDNLIQGDRYRSSFPLDEAIAEGMISEAQLRELTDKHRLLRVVQQADTARIELVHDRLVGLASKARDQRLAQTRREEERRALEEQRRIAELERVREIAFLETKARVQAEADRTRLTGTQRRLKASLVCLIGFLLLLTGVSWYALHQSRLAKTASRDASHQRDLAISAAKLAEEETRQVNVLRLSLEGRLILSGDRPDLPEGTEQGLLTVLAAYRLASPDNLKARDTALSILQREHLQFLRLLTLRDAGKQIAAVAFSPDGQKVLTGSMSNTLLLWEAATGKLLREFKNDHTGGISSVAFSPDGRRIVSGNGDRTLRLWDVASGLPVGEPLIGHADGVTSLAFSPDGRRIVSASWDKTLRFWDATTGKPIGVPLAGHTEGVTCFALSPDGLEIVSGSNDKSLRFWDAVTGRSVGEPLLGHTENVTSVAYSPDGRRIVSGSGDKTMRLWDAASGEFYSEIRNGHTKGITSVAYSPDGRRIVSGSWDKTLGFWDATDGKPVGNMQTWHAGGIISLAFSPDSRRIITGGWGRTFCLWDASVDKLPGEPLIGHTEGVNSLAFSPNGRQMVSGSGDKTLRLWDVASGRPVGAPLAGHTQGINSVAFSLDDRLIASGSWDNTLRLWDAASGRPVGAPLAGHTKRITSVAFSPDGRQIVSGSDDKTLRLWDTASGKPVREPLSGHEDGISSVAFSPDGSQIVSGSWDKTLLIWDVASGETVGGPLTGHGGGVSSVAFSPDGSQIVSGSSDNTLLIWDAASGKTVGEPLAGHEGGVSSVAFSPDGSQIVSGSSDNTLILWDAASDKIVGGPLTGHTGRISSVAFSPDGMLIASGSWDNTLRLWPRDIDWAGSLCAKLSHNMSRREWQDWISKDIPYTCQCPDLPIRSDDPNSTAQPEMCTVSKP